MLNDVPIESDENGIVLGRMTAKSRTLNIDYISDYHRGVFKCVASNAAGNTSYESELKVNGCYIDIVQKFF